MAKNKNAATSNGLAVIAASEFASLAEGGELKAAMDVMLATGETMTPQDLIRVKTPSAGGLNWEVPGVAGPELTEDITGVLVNWQRVGLLWPSDEMTEGVQPVLRTWDLQTAEQVGAIPDDMIDELEKCRIGERTFDWTRLSYNQWDSGKNGIGKRTKESRMIYILRQEDAMPMLITAGPGSLKTVVPWFKRLPQMKVPYYQCIVELKLQAIKSKGDITYSQIVPKVVGTLSEADGMLIKRTWTDQLQQIARQVDVEATD